MSLYFRQRRRSSVHVATLPMVEGLEQRLLLSGTLYLVDSLDDLVAADGLLTLREALAAANADAAVNEAPAGSAAEADLIRFSDALFASGPATLALTGGALQISGDLILDGGGADRLILDAQGAGRVIDVATAATVELRGLRVTGGSVSGAGGGVRGYLGSIPQGLPGATIILDGAVVEGNHAEGMGGGVYGATVILRKSSVIFNDAGDFGGVYGYDLTIESSLIGYNRAVGSAGGAFGSPLRVINSVVVGNVAGQSGGGLYGNGLSVVNSTVTANAAAVGAGVYVKSQSLELVNSIVSGNLGEELYGAFTMSGSLLGVDAGFVRAPDDGGDGWGDDPATPGVDESANDDYGDLGLLPDSAAVDFGDVAAALDVAGAPLTGDLAGLPRVYGTSVDAGAYELQAAPTAGREMPAAQVTTNADVFDLYDGETSLREAMWYAATGQLAGTTITFNAALSGAHFILDAQLRADGEMTLDASTLAAPPVLDGGGAARVLLVSTGASLSLTTLTITGGQAVAGGGLYLQAGATLALTDVTLADNHAGQTGGALVVHRNADVTIVGGRFIDNSAASAGGAIYIDAGSTLTISGTDFEGNSVGASGVGGAIAASSATLEIVDSTLNRNLAGGSGGAIDLWLSTLTLSDSLLAWNRAGDGGAISATGAELRVAGAVLAANRASGAGGGVHLYQSQATLLNTALVGNNAATAGGGVYAAGGSALTLTHATLTANVAADGSALASNASTAAIHNSILHANGLDAGVQGPYAAQGSLLGVDPRFLTAPDDGGDGWGDDPATPGVDESANDDFGDLRLRPDSPAVDAGDDALSLEFDATPLATDLRGAARKVGAAVDAGAYEFQAFVGDANGDETVNVLDFILLKQNYGKTSGVDFAQGDFNGDGVVDVLDFVLLKQNYGKSFSL